jgi:hypothetical protein
MFWRDRILHHGSSRRGAMNNHYEQDVRGSRCGARFLELLFSVEQLRARRV